MSRATAKGKLDETELRGRKYMYTGTGIKLAAGTLAQSFLPPVTGCE